MLSESKKILMSLNSKQKSLCQLTTTELYPKRQRKGKQQENDKGALGADALDQWFLVYPTMRIADPYFLA